MKTSTSLVLFAAFCAFAFAPNVYATASSSEGRRGGSNWTDDLPPLLSPRRTMLERVYASAPTGGGYGGNPGPISIVGKSIGKTIVNFRVSAPNAKNYVAKCSSSSPKKSVPVSVSLRAGTPPQAVLSLSGLKPSTSYTCTVYATAGSKRGPATNIPFKTLSTGPPVPLPKLKSVSTRKTTATIITTKANGATSHRALCYVASKPSALLRPAMHVTATEVKVALTNLAPSTKYVCDIFGVNSHGSGRVLKVVFGTKN